jgi:hypothetical protein
MGGDGWRCVRGGGGGGWEGGGGGGADADCRQDDKF